MERTRAKMQKMSDKRQDKQKLSSAGKLEGQLESWTSQLDELFAAATVAGAQANDPYRVRLDALRTRQLGVQTKLNDYNSPTSQSDSWSAFRATVDEDYAALELGFRELGR